jgi:hypothetical protein
MNNMLETKSEANAVHIGQHFSVSFQRTLRIPDDGAKYPLPPGLGRFPVCKVEDYADRVPDAWRERGGVFIPMYQREALWLKFNAAGWRPNALKVAVGKVNAVTGEPWNQTLSNGGRQDYLVCPDQPWLDGINDGAGVIRQFVAMPLGMGYTVEGQVTGKEEFGGIQFVVFDPKPGKFPDEPPSPSPGHYKEGLFRTVRGGASDGLEMGLGAGGRMRQKIYPDKYGRDTWDEANYGRVYVHIVNSMMYREITGGEAPPTPVTAKTYTDYKLPWFELYDEEKSTLEASKALSKVKSVKEMDQAKGFSPQQDDTPVVIPDSKVKKIGVKKKHIKDGSW